MFMYPPAPNASRARGRRARRLDGGGGGERRCYIYTVRLSRVYYCMLLRLTPSRASIEDARQARYGRYTLSYRGRQVVLRGYVQAAPGAAAHEEQAFPPHGARGYHLASRPRGCT